VSFDHAVIFTGHMIDAPGRTAARFPARAEAAAREAMRGALSQVLERIAGRFASSIPPIANDKGAMDGAPGHRRHIEDRTAPRAQAGTVVGIAGGASGGDILFHELCFEHGIPTLLRLALPVEEYIEASVTPAGGDWVRRFHALIDRLGPDAVRVLDDSVVLPEALTGGADLNIWQRTNLWMVREAVALAPRRTLLALWDGAAGDGPGGTEHLVKAAPGFGIDVAPIIRTQSLFTAE